MVLIIRSESLIELIPKKIKLQKKPDEVINNKLTNILITIINTPIIFIKRRIKYNEIAAICQKRLKMIFLRPLIFNFSGKK
jgi:hypothetical protein